MTNIVIVVSSIVIILILWYRSVSAIAPAFKKIAESDPQTETSHVVKGVRGLQLFVGFFLILFLWETFRNEYNFHNEISNIVSVLALFVLIVLTYMSYKNFNKAFEVSNYIATHQSGKRVAKRKR